MMSSRLVQSTRDASFKKNTRHGGNLPSGFAVEDEPCSSDAALLGDAKPELDECGPEEVLDVSPRPNCSATSAWSC